MELHAGLFVDLTWINPLGKGYLVGRITVISARRITVERSVDDSGPGLAVGTKVRVDSMVGGWDAETLAVDGDVIDLTVPEAPLLPERRGALRVRYEADTTWRVSGVPAGDVHVVDLSQTGARVRPTDGRVLAPSDEVVIRLEGLDVPGEVVVEIPDLRPPEYGVRFGHLGPEARQVVGALVTRLRRVPETWR